MSLRRRGAAMLLLMGILLSSVIAALSISEMAMTQERTFQRKLWRAQAEAAAEAAFATAEANCMRNAITLGASSTIIIGSTRVTFVTSDNDVNLSHTYLVSCTAALNDQRLSTTRVISGHQDSDPIFYGLWCDRNINLNLSSFYVSGSDYTGVHANGDISGGVLPSYSTGDLTATGSLPGQALAAGDRKEGVDSQPKWSMQPNLYDSAKTITVNPGTLTNLTFPAASPYAIAFCNGDLTLSGTITGKGTLCVTGKLTIAGDMSYADGASRVVILCDSDLTFGSLATSIVGTYMATGTVTCNGLGTLRITSGALLAQGDISLGTRSLIITTDRTYWLNRNEAVLHHVPGFWPSQSPNVMR